MDKLICLDCKKEIVPITKPQVGDILECQNCGTEYEVISENPVEIEIIEEEK